MYKIMSPLFFMSVLSFVFCFQVMENRDLTILDISFPSLDPSPPTHSLTFLDDSVYSKKMFNRLYSTSSHSLSLTLLVMVFRGYEDQIVMEEGDMHTLPWV